MASQGKREKSPRSRPLPTIKIAMEGLPEEHGRVRLNDFLEQLTRVASAVRGTSASFSIARRTDLYFRIIGLSFASPATAILEVVSTSDEVDDSARQAANGFMSVLREIGREGTLRQPVEYSVLQDVRQIADPVGKTLASLSLSVGRSTVDITPRFQARVARVLGPEQVVSGSIRGMLEFINLHGHKKHFRIYPDIGPSKLTCDLSERLVPEAIASVGKYVEVRGILHFKSNATNAHLIEAVSVRPIAEVDGTTLRSLRGSVPDLTGGLSSEDYVGTLRAKRD